MSISLTQLAAARKGIFTRQMEQVIVSESITKEDLLEKVAEGKIVIPANKNHTNLKAKGIGESLRTKINVNIGVSEDVKSIEMEMKKVEYAIRYDADAIMDLSCSGLTEQFRKQLIEKSPLAVGTVPVYDTAALHHAVIEEIEVDSFFQSVEKHGMDGVDFVTIHAGLTQSIAKKINQFKRVTGIVSRGGAILYEWMMKHNQENPFYQDFERLCDICLKYDITLSLGDGLRPGCLADATDRHQINELIVLGELTEFAREKGVQVMIEGPGHMPMTQIAANMQIEKTICKGAPFYVLGPLVTDVAPGYDHITSAIGGAIAASAGADFLCYVTPAEHLCLPDEEDVKEGIIASKIAAHAADIAKGIKGAADWDRKMAQARYNLDWNEMLKLAIDPEKAIRYHERHTTSTEGACTMCGSLCAVKRCKENSL